jgi:hypothetical protein
MISIQNVLTEVDLSFKKYVTPEILVCYRNFSKKKKDKQRNDQIHVCHIMIKKHGNKKAQYESAVHSGFYANISDIPSKDEQLINSHLLITHPNL